jgi:ABC-type bacteriocin/lantibiotic exporter with double-glycine peptidase domain
MQSMDHRQGSARKADSAAGMLPQKMSRYILDTSALHQLCLVALTVVVFLIEVVPLELQRRIVNDAVKHRDFQLIVNLCAVYAGVSLAHGAIKLGLNLYRGWIAQRATRDLRKRVRALEAGVKPSPETNDSGVEISMIVAEAEPIGLFVAEAVSEPLLQGGILASVLAYMVHIDPVMTLIAAGLFVPQFLFVPMMQGAINRRTQGAISILRGLSTSLTDPTNAAATNRRHEDNDAIDRVFSLNMGVFKLKFSMNFLMNLSTHLQIIAALLYGGWLVLNSQLEIGGVVAFISGIHRITDPWGDLVNYFRDISVTNVKYHLLANTVNQIAERHRADEAAR